MYDDVRFYPDDGYPLRWERLSTKEKGYVLLFNDPATHFPDRLVHITNVSRTPCAAIFSSGASYCAACVSPNCTHALVHKCFNRRPAFAPGYTFPPTLERTGSTFVSSHTGSAGLFQVSSTRAHSFSYWIGDCSNSFERLRPVGLDVDPTFGYVKSGLCLNCYASTCAHGSMVQSLINRQLWVCSSCAQTKCACLVTRPLSIHVDALEGHERELVDVGSFTLKRGGVTFESKLIDLKLEIYANDLLADAMLLERQSICTVCPTQSRCVHDAILDALGL